MAGEINGSGRPPSGNGKGPRGPVRPGALPEGGVVRAAGPLAPTHAGPIGAPKRADAKASRPAAARAPVARPSAPLSAAAAQQVSELGEDGGDVAALRHSTSGASLRHLADPNAIRAETLHAVATDPAAPPFLSPPVGGAKPIASPRSEQFIANQSLGAITAKSTAELPTRFLRAVREVANGAVEAIPFDRAVVREFKRRLQPGPRQKAAFDQFIAAFNRGVSGSPEIPLQGPDAPEGARPAAAAGASNARLVPQRESDLESVDAGARADANAKRAAKLTKSAVGLGHAEPPNHGHWGTRALVGGGAGLTGLIAMSTSLPSTAAAATPAAPDDGDNTLDDQIEASLTQDDAGANDAVLRAQLARLAVAANVPVSADGSVAGAPPAGDATTTAGAGTGAASPAFGASRSEEHTSELQSR